MTLVQLEYIVAVDTYKSFVAASKHCKVSQPSLTMQIQKLERELGLDLFDRTRLPIVTEPEAVAILIQAREILKNSRKIYSLSRRGLTDPSRMNGKRAKNKEKDQLES